MDRSTRQGSMQLARGAFARIRDAKGLLVQVHQGELWITQEDDPRDYLVGPGGSFRLQRGGVVLAHALRAATITLTLPVPSRPGWVERIGRHLVHRWAGAYVIHSRPTTAAF